MIAQSLLILLILIAHSVQVTEARNAGHESNEFDLPPQLDSDDISYFSSTYDLEGLHWALSSVFAISERNPNEEHVVHRLMEKIVSRGGGSMYTTQYKLKCDLEQAEYLVEESKIISEEMREFLKAVVIPTYKRVLGTIPPLEELQKTGGLYAFTKSNYNLGIAKIYNKALHLPEFEVPPQLLDTSSWDIARIYSDWNKQGIVVLDNVLTSSALDIILTLLLESTVWYQTKMPLKFGGYVGAYIDDGLHARILLELAFSINKALPDIMTGHDLKYMWAYKYDSRYSGINTHADQAAVNVNIWLTPDEANLDPNSGGLVIYTAKPPPSWDFEMYNMNTEQVRELLLKPNNFANVTVPYKQNRAVIFDSALFHHTDSFRFRDSYTNRRINLTMLYGDMQFDPQGKCSETQSE